MVLLLVHEKVIFLSLLGLDPDALKRLSGMVFRLAFTPCVVETTIVAIFSHLLLDLPLLWGFMMGFVLAAVSPAVVVPCLLAISEKGYGVAKGIPVSQSYIATHKGRRYQYVINRSGLLFSPFPNNP